MKAVGKKHEYKTRTVVDICAYEKGTHANTYTECNSEAARGSCAKNIMYAI